MRKRKTIDKITKRIKCPAITCRSADVQIIGKGIFCTKYQCKKCGRIFKG
nr:MAG TPA: Ribosomal L37ae protein family [Caudoviricetes sp.]